MNEGSGSKIRSIVPRGANFVGSFDNDSGGSNPEWKAGPHGLGITIPKAEGSWIRFPNVNIYETATTEYTIATKIHLYSYGEYASGGFGRILNNRHSFGDWSVGLTTNDTACLCIFDNSGIKKVSPEGSISLNTDLSVAVNKNSFYVDGQDVGISASPGTIGNVTDPVLRIGSAPEAGLNYDGLIYYIYCYNRVLSVDEIAWLHREPYAMFEDYINPAVFYISAGGISMPIVMQQMNQFNGGQPT